MTAPPAAAALLKTGKTPVEAAPATTGVADERTPEATLATPGVAVERTPAEAALVAPRVADGKTPVDGTNKVGVGK